jgi:hypothetical protein
MIRRGKLMSLSTASVLLFPACNQSAEPDDGLSVYALTDLQPMRVS